MKQIFLLFFLFLTYCGIETAQPIPRLYSPNGILVFNARSPGAGVPNETFRITWWGLNPESEFSGYNIYYTDNSADAVIPKGTKILCRNGNPRSATLSVSPPFNVSRSFQLDIVKNYYAGRPPLFEPGKEYWFFVTAYNQVRNLESPPSLAVKGVFFDSP